MVSVLIVFCLVILLSRCADIYVRSHGSGVSSGHTVEAGAVFQSEHSDYLVMSPTDRRSFNPFFVLVMVHTFLK